MKKLSIETIMDLRRKINEALRAEKENREEEERELAQKKSNKQDHETPNS